MRLQHVRSQKDNAARAQLTEVCIDAGGASNPLESMSRIRGGRWPKRRRSDTLLEERGWITESGVEVQPLVVITPHH